MATSDISYMPILYMPIKSWYYYVSPNLYSISQSLVCALHMFFHACKTGLKFVHPKYSGQIFQSNNITGPPGPQKPSSYPKACFSNALFFIAPRGLNLVLAVKRGQKISKLSMGKWTISWVKYTVSLDLIQNIFLAKVLWKKLRRTHLRIKRPLKWYEEIGQ